MIVDMELIDADNSLRRMWVAESKVASSKKVESQADVKEEREAGGHIKALMDGSSYLLDMDKSAPAGI